MRVVIFHPYTKYTKFEVRMPSVRSVARCVSALGLVTLKLESKSHQRWGTFLPNSGTPGLWVLELFAMYETDGRTDRQTDGSTKATLTPPLP